MCVWCSQYISSLTRAYGVALGVNVLIVNKDPATGVWVRRRRDCHLLCPPSTFSRCFNTDGEEVPGE